MKKIFIILPAILAAGCATSPINIKDATPVPNDRVLAFNKKVENSSTLVLTRDIGYIGSFCYFLFTINGVESVRIAPGEFVSLSVPSGEALIRYSTDPYGKGICPSGPSSVWDQAETIMKTGETKEFRGAISPNGVPSVIRVR